MEQDRMPSNKPHTYGQLIFDKESKNGNNGKKSFFNRWFQENWTATGKRMNLEHFLTPYTKLNSKWVKDLTVRLDTKISQNKRGRRLFDINHSIFLDQPPRVIKIKTKINKWDLIKLKSFCIVN